jgi:2-oxoglutarate ferredoxin oxidoreductase subunit gamma
MLKEIVIAGSGGQGIQFIGQLLGRAAVRQGLKATYVPAYGVERRGGTSFCSVVISDQEIYAPVFTQPDVLLALDQRGRNQYGTQIKSTGLIAADQDLALKPAPRETARVIMLPATQLAEQVCQGGALNLVMLGAYVTLTGIIQPENLQVELKAMSAKKPVLLETNLEALAEGLQWGRKHAK